MIANIWKEIEVFCENRHEEPVKMEIQDGPHSPFYACPKYHPENRTEEERACSNRINLVDYENMINYISDEITENVKNGCEANLTNYKWTKKGIEFHIFSHAPNEIKVLVSNKKAIR